MRLVHGMLLISAMGMATPLAAQPGKNTCLDSKRVRNWIVINDETLLLDAGRRKYRVNLQQSCSSLSTSPTLQFKSDPISGRICGSTLDAIRVRGEQCRISRIEEIDKQVFIDAHSRKQRMLEWKKTAR